MPVLMLMVPVIMKCGQNFAQRAVFKVSHVLLYCLSTRTAINIDKSLY